MVSTAQKCVDAGKAAGGGVAPSLEDFVGERLPGAFQAAARSLGVTTAELGKMTENGELTAEQLLPNLSKELLRMANAGDQLTAAMENTNSAINRFSNNVLLANKTFNESGFDIAVRRIFNESSDAISRAEPFWVMMGMLAEELGKALEGPIEAFGVFGKALGDFSVDADGFTTQFKLLIGAVTLAFRPLRTLAGWFLLLKWAVPAVTDTFEEGFSSWEDFFTKLGIWAVTAGLLASSFMRIGRGIRGIGRATGVLRAPAIAGTVAAGATSLAPVPVAIATMFGAASFGALFSLIKDSFSNPLADTGSGFNSKFGDNLSLNRDEPVIDVPEVLSQYIAKGNMQPLLGAGGGMQPGELPFGQVHINSVQVNVEGGGDNEELADRVMGRFWDTVRETASVNPVTER